MAETSSVSPGPTPAAAQTVLTVAPGPHVLAGAFTTRRMMLDVLIACAPLAILGILLFGPRAAMQVILAVAFALAAEWVFVRMRGRVATLGDLSAAVTGLILALSVPPGAPWYVAAVGSLAAIGFGKAVFGGLGQNIFNPAMVGRAFAMMAFPAAFGAGAYLPPSLTVDAISQATPLTAWKMARTVTPLGSLWLGTIPGSVGETGAWLALIGGLYLCLRGTAAWRIPAGAVLAAVVLSGASALIRSSPWTPLHHLGAGAFLFGAFYIATDPVTSPLTGRGQWIFGAGYAWLVLLMRSFSGYPEGVMFSILLMNAVTPLINRWTVPVPVGGPVPERRA